MFSFDNGKTYTQKEVDEILDEHRLEIKGINEDHADERRVSRIAREEAEREAEQVLADERRGRANEVADLKAAHAVELKKRDQEVLATEKVLAAEKRASEAETEVAVLKAKLEAAGKTEEVGAEVLEAKEMIGTIKGLTEKIIDKLPSIDISTISVVAAPVQKDNNQKNNNQQEKKS